VASDRVFQANRHVLALWDAYPVSPGHALIVPKRHIASWFEATADERRELIDTVERATEVIREERHPDGVNVGWNDGAAAGQTVFHLHNEENRTQCCKTPEGPSWCGSHARPVAFQ
jgi:prepilin-type processing-associated H-X9-DG protein